MEERIDFSKAIEGSFSKVSGGDNIGTLPSYIPELSKIDSNMFGVHLTTPTGYEFGIGDNLERFSIQSISKVFAFCIAYRNKGEKIWDRLSVEPSGTSFNSLIQLENEAGIPRNPFINAGALVICDILMSHLSDPKNNMLEFIRTVSGNEEVSYNSIVVDSEKSVGYRNTAVCNLIKSFGNIENEPSEVLDFYYHLCSVEMNCKELSKSFLFLANGGRLVSDNREILTSSQNKRVNAVMQTCGFYDESGEFSFKVGLPGKSGVGGGIIAIHPYEYSIGVWSPKLNDKGNSYRGMKFLEYFTTMTERSIF